MTHDFTEQIAKGVALLDEKLPGWLRHVDPDLIDMRAINFPVSEDEGPDDGRPGCGCVLAQIDKNAWAREEGHYERQGRDFGLSTICDRDRENHAWRYGFTVHPDIVNPDEPGPFDEAIDALTTAWKATILRLRAARGVAS